MPAASKCPCNFAVAPAYLCAALHKHLHGCFRALCRQKRCSSLSASACGPCQLNARKAGRTVASAGACFATWQSRLPQHESSILQAESERSFHSLPHFGLQLIWNTCRMWQLQAPDDVHAMLQETLNQLQSDAAAEGAFGSSTARYITGARDGSLLPAGAVWQPVRVKYPR